MTVALPPRYVNVPANLTYAQNLSDPWFRTYVQIVGLAWQKKSTETPSLRLSELAVLRGISERQVREHLNGLMNLSLIRIQHVGDQSVVIFPLRWEPGTALPIDEASDAAIVGTDDNGRESPAVESLPDTSSVAEDFTVLEDFRNGYHEHVVDDDSQVHAVREKQQQQHAQQHGLRQTDSATREAGAVVARLAAILEQYGAAPQFAAKRATRLVSQHGAAVCSRHLDWFPDRCAIAASSTTGLRNPPGLLMRSIEQNWRAPQPGKSPDDGANGGRHLSQNDSGRHVGTPLLNAGLGGNGNHPATSTEKRGAEMPVAPVECTSSGSSSDLERLRRLLGGMGITEPVLSELLEYAWVWEPGYLEGWAAYLRHHPDVGPGLVVTNVWRGGRAPEEPSTIGEEAERWSLEVDHTDPRAADAALDESCIRDDGPTELDRVWQSTLSELEHQMTRDTFNSWVRSTCLVDVVSIGEERWTAADGCPCLRLVIKASDDRARDWLENRLSAVIRRTARGILADGGWDLSPHGIDGGLENLQERDVKLEFVV